MRFITSYVTEVGIKKNVNQDSLCIKRGKCQQGEVTLAVICDGMGGLSSGELASGTLIKDFSAWFENECADYLKDADFERMKQSMRSLLIQSNKKILDYGVKNHIQLGTTVTAVLLKQDGHYLICHVGDSRAYISNQNLSQLTQDHTFIAREIARGNMTFEEAQRDPRRNVLLQCIGAARNFSEQYIEGQMKANEGMLLCSDGFRHKISEAEIKERLDACNPQTLFCHGITSNHNKSADLIAERGFNVEMEKMAKAEMKKSLQKLANLCMERQETDNISAIYVLGEE